MNRRLVLILLLGPLVAPIVPARGDGKKRAEIKRLKAELAELERKIEDLTVKIIDADKEANRLYDKAAFKASPENIAITKEAKGWDKRADDFREQRTKLMRKESDLEATINGLMPPEPPE